MGPGSGDLAAPGLVELKSQGGVESGPSSPGGSPPGRGPGLLLVAGAGDADLVSDEASGRGRAAPASAGPGIGRGSSFRVTILSMMLADARGVGEWGFAAPIEASVRRLLFDRGARTATVLANARELDADLAGLGDFRRTARRGCHVRPR